MIIQNMYQQYCAYVSICPRNSKKNNMSVHIKISRLAKLDLIKKLPPTHFHNYKLNLQFIYVKCLSHCHYSIVLYSILLYSIIKMINGKCVCGCMGGKG